MSRTRLISFSLVVGASGAIYAFTLCPTVEFIDSGELALACKNLGIAHPTGYPLYTILGRLAALFRVGSLIVRMNLMSLLFTSAAAGFLCLAIANLVATGKRDRFLTSIVASSLSLFTAFSPIWWAQGTSNEVYSLNLVLVSLFILCFLKYLTGKAEFRWLASSCYCLGLALTNHLSAVYLLPGFILILGIRAWRRRTEFRPTLVSLLFFFMPLTLYFFLPIRAAYSPFLNWGGVDDPYFLYKHITGWQYRIWMFSDADFGVVLERLLYSGRLLVIQFGWPMLALSAAGLVVVLKRNSQFGIFLALVGIFNLIYAANYQIADIDAYYLPLILAVSIFAAAGICRLIEKALKLSPSKYPAAIVAAAILIGLPLWNVSRNYFQSDRSEKTFARQGAVDIAASMDTGGLAFVENWDFYAPWLYLNFEEKYRPDMVLFDKELMRRSWYIDFIRRNYPEIYRRSEPEISLFLQRVEPFERGRAFDPRIIDAAYYGMLKAIIDRESEARPVYTNVTSDPKFLRMLRLVPDGVLYRVNSTGAFLERPFFKFDASYWGDFSVYRGPRVGQLLAYYRKTFSDREGYCRINAKVDEAGYYATLTRDIAAIMENLQPAGRSKRF